MADTQFSTVVPSRDCGDSDPWKHLISTDEASKHAATLDALPRPRFGAALEVGCSIGVLTDAVALRCDRVLAIDVDEALLIQARLRNAQHAHVRFEQASFPSGLPGDDAAQGFDLIVLSDVLRALDQETLQEAARLTLSLAKPGASVLLVHSLGPAPTCSLTGDQASERFITALGRDAMLLSQQRRPAYRIDILLR
ncbi:MAG: methyltransferase [Hyphomonas sp.]